MTKCKECGYAIKRENLAGESRPTWVDQFGNDGCFKANGGDGGDHAPEKSDADDPVI